MFGCKARSHASPYRSRSTKCLTRTITDPAAARYSEKILLESGMGETGSLAAMATARQAATDGPANSHRDGCWDAGSKSGVAGAMMQG